MLRPLAVARLLGTILASSALVAVPPTLATAADESIDFDLRTWSQQGDPDTGQWDVAPDGSEVIQQLNEPPTYFVSPETFAAATITGRFEVETSSDDDLIGFVIGYNGPTGSDEFTYDHLLFDWKQYDQGGFGGCTARAGFTLMRIDGTLSEAPDERDPGNGFVRPVQWCHEQVEDDPRVEVLATDWGPERGWQDHTEYVFRVEYTPERIRIFIDDELIFDEFGTFPEGSFGFYNYSQPNVRYSGFAAGPAPEEEEAPTEERLSGDNRFDTSVAISQDSWENGEADAVVLARADVFADSLAGTPLAVDKQGPLLITRRDSLQDEVAAEIQRVLGSDTSKTIYLLGGEAALDATVQASAAALGYEVVRISGNDRIETAVAIANELATVDVVLLTNGFNFPDALAAGPAAANVNGAVLLTGNGTAPAATDAYLATLGDVEQFAIGGPAAAAYPQATPIVGANRVATAVAVATEFFEDPTIVGMARMDDFPDSLGGGAHIATGLPELGRVGGPMVLTPPSSLASAVSDYLCANEASLERLFVYGGSAAVDESVAAEAEDRVDGTGC